VENKPGAGGTIAANTVAKAKPDGYTLMVADVGPNAVAAGLFAELPYDALNDFAPVTLGTTVPMVLIAHPDLAAQTLPDFLALARAAPGTLNFGSAGAGGISHLAGEMMNVQAKLDLVHVPYKGGGQSLAGLTGGQTQVMFVTGSSGLPLIKAERVKAIAVASNQRFPFLPDVPTMAEGGMNGFIADSWSGILAPAGTPPAIVEKLSKEFRAALNAPSVHARLTDMGFQVIASTPEEFSRFLSDEVAKWSKVIKLAGVTPQ